MESSHPDVPTSISVTGTGGAELAIVRRWRGNNARVFGLEQPVFGLALLVVMDVAIVAVLAKVGIRSAWPLPVVAAIATYMSLAGVINRTTISVRDHVMQVQHGPLPWSRPRTVPVDQLARIEVGTSGGARYCTVHAVLQSGKRVPLLSYGVGMLIVGADEVRFIGQELSRRLALPAAT